MQISILPSFADTLNITSLVLLFAAGLLTVAALHDLATRTLPNWIAAALLIPGLALRLLDGTLLVGLLAAFIVFFASFLCWRRGWMGGGDVKLLGAVALVVPPAAEAHFVAGVALAGGALALIYLAGRRVVPAPRAGRPAGFLARTARVERWRIRRGSPLPYACAIAAGFLFVIL